MKQIKGRAASKLLGRVAAGEQRLESPCVGCRQWDRNRLTCKRDRECRKYEEWKAQLALLWDATKGKVKAALAKQQAAKRRD